MKQDLKALAADQLFRFTIMRLEDSKEFHVDRKPHKRSKWWDKSKFHVWNNKYKCTEFPNP